MKGDFSSSKERKGNEICVVRQNNKTTKGETCVTEKSKKRKSVKRTIFSLIKTVCFKFRVNFGVNSSIEFCNDMLIVKFTFGFEFKNIFLRFGLDNITY